MKLVTTILSTIRTSVSVPSPPPLQAPRFGFDRLRRFTTFRDIILSNFTNPQGVHVLRFHPTQPHGVHIPPSLHTRFCETTPRPHICACSLIFTTFILEYQKVYIVL